jgi:uncharacterized membrane protein
MQEARANTKFLRTGLQSFYSNQLQAHPLAWMIGASALFLFLCSSLRHAIFSSTGWDLGIFDQIVYLISQGQPPISSFIKVHVLGDHAAWIFYPIAVLYKIYPDVHWLFVVQSASLALGALPTWHLARMAGLKERQALAVAAAYLLYPVIFNANLFDFHPEVISVPALFAAVWAARSDRVGWFCLAIAIAMGCKSVLGLSVMGLGFWLLVFEKKRLCGAIALAGGIAWFLIATQVIIPAFNDKQLTSLSRYSYLGGSVLEIAKNLLLKPGAILKVLFSLANLKYLFLLFLPVIWGISLQNLAPLVAAVPTLALNLLADYEPQKNIVMQYSLPIVPFLIVAVIATLADGRGWLRNGRAIVLWSLIVFLAMTRWWYFFAKYLPTLDTWQATREAIALVKTKGGVFTTNEISPHLSHRTLIERTDYIDSPDQIDNYKYALLNLRHPGSISSPQKAANLLEQLKQKPEFQLKYQRDDVFLYERVTN